MQVGRRAGVIAGSGARGIKINEYWWSRRGAAAMSVVGMARSPAGPK